MRNRTTWPNASTELLLPADPSELKAARLFADKAASDFGLDSDARFRFTLAANEAVANAIQYGSPSPDAAVLLRSRAEGEDLVLEVRDWGTFSVDWPALEVLPESGRGLQLMTALVDRVDLEPTAEGTVLRLLICADREDRPQSDSPGETSPTSNARSTSRRRFSRCGRSASPNSS
jgi:anti-sigma regulatory factor (Ser/Thr protein kinase)